MAIKTEETTLRPYARLAVSAASMLSSLIPTGAALSQEPENLAAPYQGLPMTKSFYTTVGKATSKAEVSDCNDALVQDSTTFYGTLSQKIVYLSLVNQKTYEELRHSATGELAGWLSGSYGDFS